MSLSRNMRDQLLKFETKTESFADLCFFLKLIKVLKINVWLVCELKVKTAVDKLTQWHCNRDYPLPPYQDDIICEQGKW